MDQAGMPIFIQLVLWSSSKLSSYIESQKAGLAPAFLWAIKAGSKVVLHWKEVVKKTVAILITIEALFIPTITHAELSPLQTQTGNNISISLSSYQYHEPGLVSLNGSKIGLNMQATQVWQSGLFFRGDLRYAFGTVDYDSNGTGSASGDLDNPDRFPDR